MWTLGLQKLNTRLVQLNSHCTAGVVVPKFNDKGPIIHNLLGPWCKCRKIHCKLLRAPYSPIQTLISSPLCQKNMHINRAVARFSLPRGQDKNISSILPHFPVGSLIFPQIFFSSSFWSSGWAARPPGKALATPLHINSSRHPLRGSRPVQWPSYTACPNKNLTIFARKI